MKAVIFLRGCDDKTWADIDVTPEQFQFLVGISKTVSTCSNKGCQPSMSVFEAPARTECAIPEDYDYENWDEKRRECGCKSCLMSLYEFWATMA